MIISSDSRKRIQKHITNLGSSDDKISVAAERRLVHFGSKAIEALIKATQSPEVKARYRAVWALGKIRDPRGFEAIVALTSDPAEEVWYDATVALGNLGDERAIPVFTRLLQNAEQNSLQAGLAVSALRRKFPEAGIPILKQIAATGNTRSKEFALEALEDDDSELRTHE